MILFATLEGHYSSISRQIVKETATSYFTVVIGFIFLIKNDLCRVFSDEEAFLEPEIKMRVSINAM